MTKMTKDDEIDIGREGVISPPTTMPPEALAKNPKPTTGPSYRNEHRTTAEDPHDDRDREHSIGAGYVLLVAREVTGLSQRRLAHRVGTSQPTLAKLETGSRIPTLRTLLRVARAAGFELVLGLRDLDADPPVSGELADFVLLGVLRINPQDDLADFVVLQEPGPFVGPKDQILGGSRSSKVLSSANGFSAAEALPDNRSTRCRLPAGPSMIPCPL
jgi:transcriptional regulator with XRE-family HTH domain